MTAAKTRRTLFQNNANHVLRKKMRIAGRLAQFLGRPDFDYKVVFKDRGDTHYKWQVIVVDKVRQSQTSNDASLHPYKGEIYHCTNIDEIVSVLTNVLVRHLSYRDQQRALSIRGLYKRLLYVALKVTGEDLRSYEGLDLMDTCFNVLV